MTPPDPTGEPANLLDAGQALELADWRRQVADLYAAVRADPDAEGGWRRWQQARSRLFSSHPQSPLPRGEPNADLLPRYFPYDPSFRVLAEVEACAPQRVLLPSSSAEEVGASLVGTARFMLGGDSRSLGVYWLDGYAGGLFISFRDASSGQLTYGAGRYLLDTAKGADLGMRDGGLVLDFNFAYQPSCSYDPSWSCPLAPRTSWLDLAVTAGERSA